MNHAHFGVRRYQGLVEELVERGDRFFDSLAVQVERCRGVDRPSRRRLLLFVCVFALCRGTAA